MFWLLLLLCLAGCMVYQYCIAPILYWRKRGVPHKTPVPIMGNFAMLWRGRISFFDSMNIIYQQFPKERYNGIFQFTIPSLLIRDLELIKRIGVKDFDHFMDHRSIENIETEPILAKNLALLSGHEWKEMRSLLSPAFTASKMKAMLGLISACGRQLVDYFVNNGSDGVIEVEMKELFTRYSNDVIATCAFGISCDSLKDKENTFYTMGTDMTRVTKWRTIKMIFVSILPKVNKLFKFRIFSKQISDFFLNTVRETIAFRLQNSVVRPDMIHLLMEARKGKLKHEDETDVGDKEFSIVEESNVGKQHVKPMKEITDEDVAAQAFIFFAAGFETSSLLLSLVATELAIHVDIQEKLLNEISDVMDKCDGNPTYEAVIGMKYLDMVVSETLRKWPVAAATDRICKKDYLIKAEHPSEKDYIIKAGDSVFIPILGLQRDEKYFPNPEKFDPERFSDENKHNILPYTYLPFGIGPRACIGSRFALLEIKMLFIHLLQKFELTVVTKTVVPLKMDAKSFKMQPKRGYWLGLKARKILTES